ncbi:FMN-dependent NADH-azoreductase [Aquimarina sediminis]|uniref:FMN-dependent NADH-azoreductase n=1 Tax=Aquimarina sediminis TaxID=2070536 RepID=UPI000CA04CD2|nr:NAD(P)H-dependent oxidoreductase [Aquimarina sediminis]
MTKTLVVSYAPRKGSYTKQLVDEFITLSQNKTEISFLDLVTSPPDLLLSDNLNLILYGEEPKYTEEEKERLSNHFMLVQQVLDTDHIVLASPMYNFSLPATVKAWVDNIVVINKTFSISEDGISQGLCKGKKALILAVAGGDYSEEEAKEYFSPAIKRNFEYIGIPSEQISAFGIDQYPNKVDSIISKAKHEIHEVIKRWY